ncbi:unnamed protein product [Pseudo-nitzschia multistriata]|uniref:peptidylprolyl isomerase n=1 Tax=Pseudo-nitzschia multistriata TaxID=183589 RepID=A0A448ZQH0_9STRA|nr:unnamed protein product [Pseudo-nitzschia multistriata]
MHITNKKFLFKLLVALAFFQAADAFSFQQRLPVSTTKLQATAENGEAPAPAVSASALKKPPTQFQHVPENTSHSSGGNLKDDEPLVLTRRKAVTSGLSLLTAATGLPLLGANAASDTEEIVRQEQPFRVLFVVQIDPSKPNELSEIEIEVRPDWAPLAAARFRKLVELGFYTDCRFFRVLPGYVAQFGIASDPALNKKWLYCGASDEEGRQQCQKPIPDEPRLQPNKRGTLSFASSGKNSRTTQIFVNLVNNDGPPNFLDPQGFVPFAQIVRGMDGATNVPKQLNSEYGGKVNQGKAAFYGAEYFQAVFPRLSVIKTATVL